MKLCPLLRAFFPGRRDAWTPLGSSWVMKRGTWNKLLLVLCERNDVMNRQTTANTASLMDPTLDFAPEVSSGGGSVWVGRGKRRAKVLVRIRGQRLLAWQSSLNSINWTSNRLSKESHSCSMLARKLPLISNEAEVESTPPPPDPMTHRAESRQAQCQSARLFTRRKPCLSWRTAPMSPT